MEVNNILIHTIVLVPADTVFYLKFPLQQSFLCLNAINFWYFDGVVSGATPLNLILLVDVFGIFFLSFTIVGAVETAGISQWVTDESVTEIACFFWLGFSCWVLLGSCWLLLGLAWLCVVDSWQHTNVFRIYDSAILGSFSDKLWHLDLRYRFKLTPSNLQLCEMQGSLLLVSCIFKCFLPAKVLYALLMCFNFCFNLFFYSTLRFKHSSGNLTVVKFNIFH